MNLCFDDSSTRRSIIAHLKKSGSLSIDELSRRVNITPMGVRQHLMALEKRGIVRYAPRKHGIGRPVFMYALTEKADMLFPKAYEQYAVGILKEVKDRFGDEKLRSLMKSRNERMMKTISDAAPASMPVEKRLSELQRVLESEGHLVEIDRKNGHWQVRNYHCPVKKIAEEFPAVCDFDLAMMQEIFGAGVTMEQNISRGDACCMYLVPAR